MPVKSRSLPVAGDGLCARCVGLCCNYITIDIDKPTNRRMRDDIRWYLLHEGVTLMVTGDRWSLKVPTRCMALGENSECTIYENRPATCREYSTENCDFHTVFEGWDTDYVEMETPEQFDTYLDARRKRRQTKRPQSVKSAAKKAGSNKNRAK